MEKDKKDKVINKITYLFSFCVAALVIILLLKYPSELDTEYIRKTFFAPVSDFVNDRVEILQYIFGIFSFCFSWFILKLFTKKYYDKIKFKNIDKIEKVINCLFLIIGVFLIGKIVLNFKYSEFKVIFTIKGFILFIVYLLFLKYYIFSDKNSDIKNSVSKMLTYLIILIIAVAYFSLYYDYSAFLSHHSDAYYYPILKMFNGLTPGIDFTSIYGYYSYLYYFIMKIFNNNSIMLFSIINIVLVVISLLNIKYFCNKLIKNEKITFLVITSIVFYLVIYHLLNENGIYIQFFPHRVLFASIILAYSAFASDKLDNELYKILGYFISCFAMLYNFETGGIIILTWTSLLVYDDLIKYTFKDKKFYFNILKLVSYIILSVILYLFVLFILTYIKSGEVITLNSILFGIGTFLGSGFYMLRIEKYQPWIILAIFYTVYLVKALGKIKIFKKTNEISLNDYLLFTITILGIGMFTYYLGRSHMYVFTLILYPFIILLGYILSEALKNKSKNDLLAKCIFIFLTISSFLTIYSAYFNRDVSKFIFNKKHFTEYFNLNYELESISDVKEKIPDLEFFINYESRYYLYYNDIDKKPFEAFVDTFSYEQLDIFLDYLNKEEKSILIHPTIFMGLYNGKFEELKKLCYNKYAIYNRDYTYLLISKKDIEKMESLKEYERIYLSEK